MERIYYDEIYPFVTIGYHFDLLREFRSSRNKSDSFLTNEKL
ncbi:hypothetical protein L1283_000456 [Sphingobacterium sp. HSC-15S19]